MDDSPTNNTSVQSQDPFASQRDDSNGTLTISFQHRDSIAENLLTDPFAQDKLAEPADADEEMRRSSSPPNQNDQDRRMSREWDASKVPPSQFQRRKGSIYSTPNSRDGHVKGSSRDKAYHDKLKEKVCLEAVFRG
jgi:hypothetical protein